jgi:hypothetical protein
MVTMPSTTFAMRIAMRIATCITEQLKIGGFDGRRLLAEARKTRRDRDRQTDARGYKFLIKSIHVLPKDFLNTSSRASSMSSSKLPNLLPHALHILNLCSHSGRVTAETFEPSLREIGSQEERRDEIKLSVLLLTLVLSLHSKRVATSTHRKLPCAPFFRS